MGGGCLCVCVFVCLCVRVSRKRIVVWVELEVT